MKLLFTLLLLIPSLSKADEKKYGYWISDTFIKCPNLLDALIDSELLDYKEQILDGTNEFTRLTTYLIKKKTKYIDMKYWVYNKKENNLVLSSLEINLKQ